VVRVRVLGEAAIDVAGRDVGLSAPRERAVLALLAVRLGTIVTVTELIDGLWPDDPPPNARKAVQTYVARVRKQVPVDLIESVGDGYRLNPASCEVDADQFDRLVEQGRSALRAGLATIARDRLTEALRLWSGEPLVDLGDVPAAVGARVRLHEARLGAQEDLLDAHLALGEHAAAVADAEHAVAVEPLRERRWAQLMVALYRSGRQADALRAFQRCREVLIDELGVEPGADLTALERRILDQDPGLAARSTAVALRAAPDALPTALAESSRQPMVGRRNELDDVVGAWEDAVAGAHPTVLVRGEPGAGKTRLTAALGERVIGDGGVVLLGRCHPELAVPFQPFAEALAPLVAEGSEHSMFEAIAGLTPGGRSSGDAEQYRLFQGVVDVIAAVAAERPTVLVLEDLHWATAPTTRLLRYVIAAPELDRVLIVGTARHTEGTSLADLGELASVRTVALAPLAVADVDRWVEARIGPDRDLAARLHDLAGGNPFLIEQLLLDHEAGADDAGRVTRSGEVVSGRLARLRPATREVLELAATAGISFDLPLLAASFRGGQEAVLDALEEAESAGLLVGSTEMLGRFRFCHAIVRTALTESLSATRALRLHRDLANELESRGADAAIVGALARHCAAAAPLGLAERAVAHAERAGELARAALAFEEAAEFFELAVQAMAHVAQPDPGRRCDLLTRAGEALRRGGDPRGAVLLDEAATLARQLGDARRSAAVAFALGRLGFGLFESALDSSCALVAADALRALGDDEPALRARLLAVLATEEIYTAVDDSRRIDLSNEAIALARAAGDRQVLATVLVSCVTAWTDPLDLGGRLRLAREAAAIADDLGDVELVYRAQHLLSLALLEAADLDGYRSARARTRAAGAELNQPSIRVELLCNDASDLWVLGDGDGTEQLFAEAAGILVRCGAPELMHDALRLATFGRMWLDRRESETALALCDPLTEFMPRGVWAVAGALFRIEQGDVDAARADLDRFAVADFTDIPRRLAWSLIVWLHAQLVVELDDRARAKALLELMEPLSGRVIGIDPSRFDVTDRLIGRLCVVVGRLDDARAHLDAALDLSRRLSSPVFEARTLVDLAHLEFAQGDVDSGDAHLERARLLAGPLRAEGILAAADRAARDAGRRLPR
jgi:DNA-binding SARP family transcriptional activator